MRSKCNAYGGTFKYLGQSAELYCVLDEGGHKIHVAVPFGRVQEWRGSYSRNAKPRVYEQVRVPITSFVIRDEEAPRPSWIVRLWRWFCDLV